MTLNAREALEIFWDGEEVPGLTFYGLRSRRQSKALEFPTAWNNYAEHRASLMHGNLWEAVIWDTKINSWPSDDMFRELLLITLTHLLNSGCKVAWVGREGFFVDPPDLFLPEFMSSGILAALSAATGFRNAISLDQPLKFLSDTELLEFRRASDGLAQAN